MQARRKKLFNSWSYNLYIYVYLYTHTYIYIHITATSASISSCWGFIMWYCITSIISACCDRRLFLFHELIHGSTCSCACHHHPHLLCLSDQAHLLNISSSHCKSASLWTSVSAWYSLCTHVDPPKSVIVPSQFNLTGLSAMLFHFSHSTSL